MAEVKCGRPSCRCAMSSQSPSPFCCEECERHATDTRRCDCDHDACGGVPGKAERPDTVKEILDTDPIRFA